MTIGIDLIVGAIGNTLGNLGSDFLKDAKRQAAFRTCLASAVKAVEEKHSDLVYNKFLDKHYFSQEVVVLELKKLLGRSGKSDIDALFEQYRLQWQMPENAPSEGRAAIELFIDALSKCLYAASEFRAEYDSRAEERTAAATEQTAESAKRSEALLAAAMTELGKIADKDDTPKLEAISDATRDTAEAIKRTEIQLTEVVSLLRKLIENKTASSGPWQVMQNFYKWLERSGGVNLTGDSVDIGGDVAGRDIVKVFMTGVNAPDEGRKWEFNLWKEYRQATQDFAASASDIAAAIKQLSQQLRPAPKSLQLWPAPAPAPTGNAHLLTWQDIEDHGRRMNDPLRAARNFYNAARPTWGHIYHEHDARRDSQADIMEWLASSTETSVVLVLAAGGDGKTTMLMRIAADLAREGRTVIWRGAGDYLSWPIIEPHANQPLIVVVDYAHELDAQSSKGNLAALINHCQTHNLPVSFVLTARKNEWTHAHINIGRVPKQIIDWTERAQRLSRAEAGRFIDKLAAADELGTLAGKPRAEQIRLFVESTEGQLLASMISIKGGAHFRDILQSVVDRIGTWADGPILQQALRYVCAVHQWEAYITPQLLAKIMDYSPSQVDDLILRPLVGEIAELEDNAGRIRTRHAIIAQVLFAVLTLDRAGKRASTYLDLFSSAVALKLSLPQSQDYKLLTILPLAIRRAGDIAEARRIFEQAAKADPRDAQTLQAWALMEKEERNIPRARELFEQAAKADPKHAPVFQAWALMEKEERNIPRARELFEQAAKADPKHAPVFQAWALMEKEERNIPRARELFEQAAKADPKHAPVFQAWALMEKEERNIPLARELFEQAAKADPRDAQTLQAWALMEKEERNIPLARELFEQAAKADPRDAQTLQAWALMEKEERNIPRARELFEQAAKADPRDAQTLQAWALMEKEERNIPRARELFEQAAKADPKHAPVFQAWALMEESEGNTSEADRLFQKAIEVAHLAGNRRWEAWTHGDWAKAFNRRGDREKALEQFRLAVKVDPRSAFSWAQLADLASRLGLIDEARSSMMSAENNMPRDARRASQIKRILSEVRHRLGTE